MDDALQTAQLHPLERTFVLKLHRDSRIRQGELRGRVLHVLSDARADVASVADLLEALSTFVQETNSAAVPDAVHCPAP